MSLPGLFRDLSFRLVSPASMESMARVPSSKPGQQSPTYLWSTAFTLHRQVK